MTVTRSQQFVSEVLTMRPRVAVFDCDGTLWENNSGEDFLEWSMQRGLVGDAAAQHMRARYARYKNGQVGEVDMCGEMVTMYAGRGVAEMEAAARAFFDEIVAANLFAEFMELTHRLKEQGCDLWSVSSTNSWVVREGAVRFGIPAANVLAGEADCPNGVVSGRLTRMPSGEGKAAALREFVTPKHREIAAVFGNSIHDAAMLRLAQHPFAVNPNPDLEQIARREGWMVYWPERMAVGR